MTITDIWCCIYFSIEVNNVTIILVYYFNFKCGYQMSYKV